MINWRAFFGKRPNGANFLGEQPAKFDHRKTVAIAEPNPYEAAVPSREFEQFSREVAIVLGRELDQQDLEKDLINELGLDELDVAECLIIAETAWGVVTPRQATSSVSEWHAIARFRCLQDLVDFAQNHK
ncbi:MAG: hypothetical protein AAFN91_04690 [Pseudomonadota bacterium]